MLIRKNDLPSVIELVIDGEVTEEEMDQFEAYFKEKKQKKHGHDKMNVLIEIRDLDYTVEGLIEEIKFDTKHLNDFHKVAVVGDKKWIKLGDKLAQFMPQVEVEQFEPEEIKKARTWVT